METEILTADHTAIEVRITNELKRLLERLDFAHAAAKTANQNDSQMSRAKMEPLKIPEFHGDPTEWTSFRDKFKALVHEKTYYTNVEKFSYLQVYLKDKKAPAVIRGPATEAGYESAWKSVCDQYDNDRNLLRSLFDTLLKTKNMSEESESEMIRVRNEIQAVVDAVARIPSCTKPFEALIAHIGIFRMYSKSRDHFETKNDNKIPLWDDLSSFLDARSKTLAICAAAPKFQQKTAASTSKNSNSTPAFKPTNSKGNPSAHVAQTGKKITCALCKDGHFTTKCSQVINSTPQDLLKKIESSSLCINCLGSHNVSDCQSKFSCMLCNQKHYTKLHNLFNKRETQAHHTITVAASSNVMLQTAVVHVLNGKGQWVKKRALLANGATRGFMKASCADELGIAQNAVNLCGSGVTNQNIEIKSVALSKVKNFDSSFKCELEFNVVKQITAALPSRYISKSEFKIPDGYRLADPLFNVPTDCDMLIGNDIYDHLRVEGKLRLDNGIMLKNTVFGWVVSGPLQNPSPSAHMFATNFQVQAYNLCDLNESIQKFWTNEDYRNDGRLLTDEEARVEEHFQTTYVRHENGEFEVTIPTNGKETQLANNFHTSLNQFLALEKRLEKNPELKEKCHEFMQEYITRDDMSPIDMTDDSPDLIVYYVSYHPILKEDSTTTKLRIVFNGSQKTASGISLNDTQLIGPNVQTDTSSLLVQFRKPDIVATADIAKMYRMFKINESQRSMQRIIYRAKPSDPIQVYQLNTITYGTRFASYAATRCVKQLAIDSRRNYPEAADILEHNTYVDDVIFGFDTLDEHIKVTKDLLTVTESAKLDLRKFKSNNQDAIAFLPESKREVDNESKIHKALGIKWNTEFDTIEFTFHHMPDIQITKRVTLSEISKNFDPNGLLGPVTFTFKCFMRSVHQSQKNWDQILAADFQQRWIQLAESSKSVNAIRIPRHAVIKDAVSTQLHGFSDASMLGYGACVFIVSHDANDNYESNLLMSRSRLAGESQMPRLEVNGGVILAHMMAHLGDLLGIEEKYCWMDSLIALCWIAKEPANLKDFIANRIKEIQVTTKDKNCIWRHVPTDLNSADLLSRGMTADEFEHDQYKSELWWKGPDFLRRSKSEWPTTLMEIDTSNPDYQRELRKFPLSHFFIEENPRIDQIISCHHATSSSTQEPFIVHEWIFNDKLFGSTHKIRSRIAIMCRFIHNASAKLFNKKKRVSTMSPKYPVSLADYRQSDVIIARIIQMHAYPREFKALRDGQMIPTNSKLIQHNPKWNKDQRVIRLGNRGEEMRVCNDMKHPLPVTKCHYTLLLLAEIHRENVHCGIRTAAGHFNSRYHMPDINTVARSVIHRCIPCFRRKPKLAQQYMGDLPDYRVNFKFPFYETGVDYAGPIEIKSSTLRKAPHMKAYIAIFVCMASGCTHVEAVSSLSADSFKQAFHRFTSRRGLCRTLHSDNAGNFVGTANEQKQFKQYLADHFAEFQEFFQIRHVDYRNIPARSPTFGGLWENRVKQVKRHLYPAVGNTILTFEELATICCRIEAVLNSQPITAINNDPNDPEPLTRGHFIIGRSLLSLPEEDVTNEQISDMKRFRRNQQIFQHFHKRWLNEVLIQAQKRTKNFTATSNFKVGQVVLMVDENAPPQYWPLALIEKIIPGKDNLVRVVTLRTGKGKIFTRSINKIATLPISDNLDAHHFSPGECHIDE